MTTTVLIVDDEPALRDVVARAIESAGFVPMIAASVAEAKGVLADVSVDVVLTDVLMPDADGVDLARHVTARYPGVGLVFMSGSVDATVAREFDGARFVRKPFTVEEITAAIRGVVQR